MIKRKFPTRPPILINSNVQLAKMESAVKTMHSVANEQAAKYRGDMKKVKFGSYYLWQTLYLSLMMPYKSYGE